MHVTRTTTQLLEGLHDPGNREAWDALDGRYRPLVLAFARRLGLGDSDAADVAQETLTQFFQEYAAGRYDRERGRLRTWLIQITKTKAAQVRRRAVRRREHAGASMAEREVDPGAEDAEAIWEACRRRTVVAAALDELRATSQAAPRTLEAFELLVRHQQTPAAVAERLGMQRQDVYLAKSRLGARLREIVERLERAWDDDV